MLLVNTILRWLKKHFHFHIIDVITMLLPRICSHSVDSSMGLTKCICITALLWTLTFCITNKDAWYVPWYWSADNKKLNCFQLITLTRYDIWLLDTNNRLDLANIMLQPSIEKVCLEDKVCFKLVITKYRWCMLVDKLTIFIIGEV